MPFLYPGPLEGCRGGSGRVFPSRTERLGPKTGWRRPAAGSPGTWRVPMHPLAECCRPVRALTPGVVARRTGPGVPPQGDRDRSFPSKHIGCACGDLRQRESPCGADVSGVGTHMDLSSHFRPPFPPISSRPRPALSAANPRSLFRAEQPSCQPRALKAMVEGQGFRAAARSSGYVGRGCQLLVAAATAL